MFKGLVARLNIDNLLGANIKMKFNFVSAPTINDFFLKEKPLSDFSPSIPIGILSLAAVLEQKGGVIPSVVNLDRLFVEWSKYKNSLTDFAKYAACAIAATDAQFFGFSSICSSYPLTLRIISLLKQLRPDILIILGGPQASASAAATLKAFPSVDFVVRGEGENILPKLLDTVDCSGNLDSVLGISYLSNGHLVHNSDAPIIENLDSLPMPAYHLIPWIKELCRLPVEAGRGCPFSCTYCSTNQFFRRKYRLKTPEIIVQQMLELNKKYEIERFSLLHDNFTANRKRVIAFCKELSKTDMEFSWECSARIDCIDKELIELMGKAGCSRIFLGIESGSKRIQESIRKKIDLDTAMDRICHLNSTQIDASVSFIIGFPDETIDDLRMTANYFIELLRYEHVKPQIGLLSPLTGTPIQQKYHRKLINESIVSEVAFQSLEQYIQEIKMVASYPDIFSNFYSIPTAHFDRKYAAELKNFLLFSMKTLRWLFVALIQMEGDIIDLFNCWRDWHISHGDESIKNSRINYSSPEIRNEFLRFVLSKVATNENWDRQAIIALVEKASSNFKDLAL